MSKSQGAESQRKSSFQALIEVSALACGKQDAKAQRF
jgi:hypothetical protein